jgi:DNA-binding CsgD family transcriptional regulator
VAYELSPREQDYLQALVEYGDSKAMGKRLGVSPERVDHALQLLMTKLEVRSRVLLAVKAIRLGLVEL